jgi:hypothetical protein
MKKPFLFAEVVMSKKSYILKIQDGNKTEINSAYLLFPILRLISHTYFGIGSLTDGV